MNHIVVDRIEGRYAVCEMPNGKLRDIELSSLPKGVREGSVLVEAEGGWAIDENEERTRRSRISRKMNAIFED